jgi:hypothetical protein
MTRPDTAVYFTTVTMQSSTRAIIGGHLFVEEAEPTVTRVYVCDDGDWSFVYDIEDVVYASTGLPGSSERRTVCFLGRQGLFRENAPGKKPKDGRVVVHPNSYWMDLRYIAGDLYACGIQNQVARRTSKGWVAMDMGIAIPLGDEVTATLHSIDGFAADDIYAVGDGGALWHWDGQAWRSLSSQTNLPLYCVRCLSNGQVVAAGSGGTILVGAANAPWQDVSDTAQCNDVYQNVVEFKGQIYLSATDQLMTLQGSTLSEVNPNVRGSKAYYAMDADHDSLWVVGDEAALRYDGKKWHRYECPDNS